MIDVSSVIYIHNKSLLYSPAGKPKFCSIPGVTSSNSIPSYIGDSIPINPIPPPPPPPP